MVLVLEQLIWLLSRTAPHGHPKSFQGIQEVRQAPSVSYLFCCEFPYKSRVMGTSEPLKPLKAPYMARNPVKWVFFRLKGQEIPLKI